jgi:threonine/homoserine/homoserine lactone efflux protein
MIFLILFLKGSLIGFSMAMPVGPVGVLCIQHSLRRGLLAGLMAGLGAALADALYGCMAGFGVTLFSQVLTTYQIWFQMIGAFILWFVGIKIFTSKPAEIKTSAISFSCSRIFLSTFALTLTNPFTLLCFAGIYAGLEITPSNQEILPVVILSLGILVGAVIWWMVLTFGVTLIGRRFELNSSPLLNRISGAILTSCGCLASLSALKQLIT